MSDVQRETAERIVALVQAKSEGAGLGELDDLVSYAIEDGVVEAMQAQVSREASKLEEAERQNAKLVEQRDDALAEVERWKGVARDRRDQIDGLLASAGGVTDDTGDET